MTTGTPDADAEETPPGVTPLRVLSLWVGFTFSVGAVTQVALNVTGPALPGDYVGVAYWGTSLLAALALLRVRPGIDTHVLWRINYGFVLGIWLAFGVRMVSVATGEWFVVDPFSEPVVLVPVGVGFAIAGVVEWYRNHREN